MATDMNRHFPEEKTWMAHQHIKRCSISLVKRKMLIKMTMKCYFMFTRLEQFLNLTILSVDENMEQWNCSLIASGLVDWVKYFGKEFDFI